MNKHFLRVRIEHSQGRTSYGYICLNDVTAYREHLEVYTLTVVEADNRTYIIHMRLSDFHKIMKKYFTIIDDTNGTAS